MGKRVHQDPKRTPENTLVSLAHAPAPPGPTVLRKWQRGAGNQAVQRELREPVDANAQENQSDGVMVMPPMVITGSPPKPQDSGTITMPPMVITGGPPKPQDSGTITMEPMVITGGPPTPQDSGTITMEPMVITGSPRKPQDSGVITMEPMVITGSPRKPRDSGVITMEPMVITGSPPKVQDNGTIVMPPLVVTGSPGGSAQKSTDAASPSQTDELTGAQPQAADGQATPSSEKDAPSDKADKAAPTAPQSPPAAPVQSPTAKAQTGTPNSETAEPVAGDGGGGGGGPEVSKWRTSAVGAAKSLSTPKISSATGSAKIRTSGGAASAKHKAAGQQAGKDASKAISPPPKAGQMPENPVAPPDPVPEATKIVNAALGKSLPDLSVPGLEKSPLTQLLPSLTPPPPPAPAAAPEKSDPAKKPGDSKNAKNPVKDKADKVDKAAEKKPDQTPQRSDADPIILKDENRPKEKPFPPALKSQIGLVIADLLQDADKEAKDILVGARLQMYAGQVDREFPNYGEEKLLPRIKTALDTELRDVAHQAGLTDAEIASVVERRRQMIKTQAEQAKYGLTQTGDEQKDAVKQSGDEALQHIAGAKKALDVSAEQKLAAAKGEGDPEVIRLRRDRLLDDVNQKIADSIVAMDEAGKRRKAQLRAVADAMKAAYRRRAEDDETKLVADATAAKTDVKAAQLTAAQSFNWANTRKTALDKFVMAEVEKTDTAVKTLQWELRTEGGTARELIRKWAKGKTGEQLAWLQEIIDHFLDWYKAAQAESQAWETQRNKATRDAVAADIVSLNMTIALGGNEIDVDKEGALDTLTAEQRAVFKAYYSKTSKTKGDSIAAVAAGLRVRIAKTQTPELMKKIESQLDDEAADKCHELEALAKAETPSFSAAHVADEVYAGLHGGLTGWNDEKRVFNALTGLTKPQSRAVRAYYQHYHKLNLERDLRSELKSTIRKHDPEADRAVALLEGDPDSAEAANIYYALHGGLGVNDTDTVMKALRNKSPEQQARIKKFYLDKYKLDLDKDLNNELKPLITNDTHDVEQAKALREGDVNRADVIAVDGALHGGLFGRGGIIYADHEKIEAVHKQIREDVVAELDAKAESEARATHKPKHDVTSKEIEAEVARRNRQLESGYGVEYGAALEAKGEKRDGALRAAYKDRFGDNPKDDARIQLVTGLLDNDLHKVDAAKLGMEHQSFFYASDEIQNDVLEAQYKRALEDKKRDVGPGLRREMEKRRAADAEKGQPWDKYTVRAEEKKIEKQLEEEAKGLAKLNMDNLRTSYDSTVSKLGGGMFEYQLSRYTSGYDHNKSILLREQGGYLSPAQQVFFATEGVGTSGDQFKAALKGKSKEELEQIRKELLQVRVDQIARSDWKWKSEADIKRLKAKWLEEHTADSLAQLVDDETSGRLEQELNFALRGEPKDAAEENQLALDKLAYEKNHPGVLSSHQLEVLEKRVQRMEDQYKLVQEQDALIKAAENDPSVSPADRKKLLEERVQRLAKFGQISSSVDSAVDKHAEQVNAVADAVVKTVTTIIAIVVLVVVAIGSAGSAVPAEIAAVSAFLTSAAGAATVAAGTAVLGVAIKAAILRDAYEGETALKELGIGTVDAVVSAATAGVGGKFLTSAFDQLAVKLAKEGWSKAEIAALKVMMSEGALQKPVLGRLAAKGPLSNFIVQGMVSSGENFAQGVPSAVVGVALDRSPGDPGKKLKQALKENAIQSAAMGYGGHVFTTGVGKAATKVFPDKAGAPKIAPSDPSATVKEGDGAAASASKSADQPAVKPDDPVLKPQDELPAGKRGEDKIADDAQKALQKGELQTPEQKTKPTDAKDEPLDKSTETVPEQKKPQADDSAQAKPKASTDDPEVNAPKQTPDTGETSSMAGTQNSGAHLRAPPEPAPGPVKRAWNNTKKRYYQYKHDRWVKSVLEGGMASGTPPKVENPGPPFDKNHFTYQEGVYAPEKAYQAYNDALARANGREVGIYRDRTTGEYVVRVGDHGSVGAPYRKTGDFETVLHYHPNDENVLVYRNPAPNDVGNTARRWFQQDIPRRPVTEFVEFPLPDGSRGRTAWTVTSDTGDGLPKVIVEYVNAKGERVKKEYIKYDDFEKEWGSRTRYVDPDSLDYQDLRRDIESYLRSLGHEDIVETDLPLDYGSSSKARSTPRVAPSKSTSPPGPNPRKVYAESEWRSFIDNPPKGKTADDMRYQRYLQNYRENNGGVSGAMDRSDWQVVKDRLEANSARGRQEEDATLAAAGVENNNYTTSTITGEPRDIVRYDSKKVSPGEIIATRPDGVADKYWVDVKATEQDTIYYTQQLAAQKEGAAKGKPPKKLAVVITNDNPDGVRPSSNLVKEALVLHRDNKTGEWRVWNQRANDGIGAWGHTVTREQVSALLGGVPPK